MDNVRRKHLSFRKARIKMLVSDQVAETCDACDRTEDLRVLHFSIYADFYSDRKSIKTDKTMDGANLLQQIWYVELPAIKNIIVIQFILQAGNIMSIGFEKAYALQTDMNLPASEILSTYVYRIGLLNGDYGYSTAVGLFNSVVNVILLIFVNWVVKKLNDGEGL